MHYSSWPLSRTHPSPYEALRPLPLVMSYGLNNRNFPGLDRKFPEGKIRRIPGENPVSSRVSWSVLNRVHTVLRLLYVRQFLLSPLASSVCSINFLSDEFWHRSFVFAHSFSWCKALPTLGSWIGPVGGCWGLSKSFLRVTTPSLVLLQEPRHAHYAMPDPTLFSILVLLFQEPNVILDLIKSSSKELLR